jgi:hypothetical protein
MSREGPFCINFLSAALDLLLNNFVDPVISGSCQHIKENGQGTVNLATSSWTNLLVHSRQLSIPDNDDCLIPGTPKHSQIDHDRHCIIKHLTFNRSLISKLRSSTSFSS